MVMPEFFLVGAPKAGTTALHAALSRHPALFLPRVKEPKFFLTDGGPPPRGQHRGPGDAHSRREWVWRRSRYEAAFAAAPPGTLVGESTPLYLSDPQALQRIADAVPHAKLLAVLRDPVDRAYSNWMHLWSDGLEPERDFLTAFRLEDERRRAGWAPFWWYRELGLYGKQLTHLYAIFPAEQVLVLRYRQLVDEPARTLDDVCRFLGVPPRPLEAPAENSRPFVRDDVTTRRLARLARGGAWAGQFAPPQVWRKVSIPLLNRLHARGGPRPQLTPQVRAELVDAFAADIAVLERLLGRSFADWLGERGPSDFATRRAGLSSGSG